MTCTTSPCTINGLDPGTEYQFTVIPKNNCGSATGCAENTATAETACECNYAHICVHCQHLHESLKGKFIIGQQASQLISLTGP